MQFWERKKPVSAIFLNYDVDNFSPEYSQSKEVFEF